MKNAILLHGTGGNPDNFWFGWLRKQLLQNDFAVAAPQMPNADQPNVKVWSDYALENLALDDETIMIGHSAGCPTILAILEKIKFRISRVILVAGWIRLNDMKDDDVMLLQNPDWDRIKVNGREFFFFNSDNDPWGCGLDQGQALREKLGGTLISCTGEGHFGSKTFNQPYGEFPLLKDICLLP